MNYNLTANDLLRNTIEVKVRQRIEEILNDEKFINEIVDKIAKDKIKNYLNKNLSYDNIDELLSKIK